MLGKAEFSGIGKEWLQQLLHTAATYNGGLRYSVWEAAALFRSSEGIIVLIWIKSHHIWLERNQIFFFSLKRMVFFWDWLQKRWCHPVLFWHFWSCRILMWSCGPVSAFSFFTWGGERDGKCLNSWWGFCVCVFWGVVGGLRNLWVNVTLSTGITGIVLQVGFISKSIRPNTSTPVCPTLAQNSKTSLKFLSPPAFVSKIRRKQSSG